MMLSLISVSLVLVMVTSAKSKPNIMFLLTDDQDLRLGSMVAMPQTRAAIVEGGANISNYFIHTPICCPSRTTLLSGKFYHNNKVASASDPGCMRMNTSKATNPEWWHNTVTPRLHADHGYTTGLFGKVLNSMNTYGCVAPDQNLPEGVDRLMIMCGATYNDASWADFGDASLSNNSVGIVTGYTTSIVGNKTLEWIKSVVESGATHKPFFAYMGPHAPHLPSTPAPWYADHPVGNTPVPKQIYYNYSGVGKHAFGALPSLAAQNVAIDEAAIAQEHSNRLKTLLSVDDIVGVIHSYLVSVNEWDNTYWLQTSDHGYSLGQFMIDSHKTQVWDHNTRVPMMIKGPMITPGTIFSGMTSMADLAPTILELAAGGNDASAVPEEMDGASFAPMLTNQGNRPWKEAVLVEYQSIRTTIELTEEERSGIGPAAALLRSAYGFNAHAALQAEGVGGGAGGGRGIQAKFQNFHDGPNNTFVAIRIINTTSTPAVDMLYAEFADVNNPLAWNFAPDQLNYFELYDVTTDYFMLENIYPTADAALKEKLHTRLQAAIKCKGTVECSSYLYG